MASPHALYAVVLSVGACTVAQNVVPFTQARSWKSEAPPVQMQVEVDEKTIDPSVLLGPNATIPEESFDESDDVRSWDGGSTDFSFDEDEEFEMSSKSSEALPVDVLLDEDE